jgi:C1A family cysteine protease
MIIVLPIINTMAYPSFEEFRVLYNKTYATRDILTQRAMVYQQNIDFIRQHNANPLYTYKLGVNPWADLSWEEFQDELHIRTTVVERSIPEPFEPEYSPLTKHFSSRNIPSSWDWRTQGTVNFIRNQGRCGSCWAFSAICALEHKVKIKNGTLFKLSEQQLVDCDRGNSGCNGGLMTTAYQYMMKNSIALDAFYPYTGKEFGCKRNVSMLGVFRTTGFAKARSSITGGSLQNLAYQQVLAVGIHINRPFQFYASGIYNGPCKESINHAVNIVGYTPQFWIIRNSWGTRWGELGYMRLSRVREMICGIRRMINYPLV